MPVVVSTYLLSTGSVQALRYGWLELQPRFTDLGLRDAQARLLPMPGTRLERLLMTQVWSSAACGYAGHYGRLRQGPDGMDPDAHTLCTVL